MTIRQLAGAILSTCICVVMCAQSASAENHFGVPDSYDGLAPDGLSMLIPSVHLVRYGVFYYWRAHDRWPESWQAVVDAGYVTKQLTTPFGEVIDPDDRRIDFDYDIQYNYKGDRRPQLVLYNSKRAKPYQFEEFPTGPSYSQVFSRVGKQSPIGSRFNRQADNRYWLRTYIAGSIMKSLLADYCILHGASATWDGFAASDFFPQAVDSFNPLTGKPWNVDGSPGSYLWVKPVAATDIPTLKMVDPQTGDEIGLML